MSEPIKVGDLVMIVRGHECAVRLRGGLPWTVTGFCPQSGGGWYCPVCYEHNIGASDALGALGCPRPVEAGSSSKPSGGIPLSWLKRIPPLSELEGVDEKETLHA